MVHRSRLLNLFTHDPGDDRYDNRGDVVDENEKNKSKDFRPFAGTTLIPHQLYLAQDTLFRINHPTTLTLEFTLGDWDDAYEPFFRNNLRWKTWAAGEEKDITPRSGSLMPSAGSITVDPHSIVSH